LLYHSAPSAADQGLGRETCRVKLVFDPEPGKRENTVSLSNPPTASGVRRWAGMETEFRVKPRLIDGESYRQIVSRVRDFISWFMRCEGVLYIIS